MVTGSQWELDQLVPLNLGRKGAMGYIIPDMMQFLSSSSVVQVGTFLNSCINGETLLPIPCVLSMVKGHHLQLIYSPPLYSVISHGLT